MSGKDLGTHVRAPVTDVRPGWASSRHEQHRTSVLPEASAPGLAVHELHRDVPPGSITLITGGTRLGHLSSRTSFLPPGPLDLHKSQCKSQGSFIIFQAPFLLAQDLTAHITRTPEKSVIELIHHWVKSSLHVSGPVGEDVL